MKELSGLGIIGIGFRVPGFGALVFRRRVWGLGSKVLGFKASALDFLPARSTSKSRFRSILALGIQAS